MGNIKIDMVSYDVHINWQSYLLTIALTILFAVVVDVFMYSRLDKINMAEIPHLNQLNDKKFKSPGIPFGMPGLFSPERWRRSAAL